MIRRALDVPIKVAIAGVGAVTAFGSTVAELWEGAREGRVAIRPVRILPMERYQTRIGGEVDRPQPATSSHGWSEPVLDFVLGAADEAMRESRLDGAVTPERWAVVAATCNGGIVSGERWYSGLLWCDEAEAEPARAFAGQAMAEALSHRFGIKGPVVSLNTACAAGANAIGYGFDLISDGAADAVLVGAADSLSSALFAGFSCMEALSPNPAAPYSKARNGLSIGEGAGALVLARGDLAAELQLPVLVEVAGYGLSADGYHPTAPHPEGEGAARAIRAGLRRARVESTQVAYVNGHGTGTPRNDPAESNAIRLALGEHASEVPISSTKSVIGHLMGAAGAVEAIVTAYALRDQVAPPTAGFTEPDPECGLDHVPNVARPFAGDVAISNNFAFGGANACLVLARPGFLNGGQAEKASGVVISGLGAITPAGIGLEVAWNAYRAGQTAFTDVDGVRISRIAATCDEWLSARQARRMDRTAIYAVVASALALRHAGLELSPANRERVGVLFGTFLGPADSLQEFMRAVIIEGPEAANPALFPNTVFNAAAGQVAMHTGAVGPTSTVTAGHAAGAVALCYASDIVRRREADAMLSLGVDTLADVTVRAYRALRLLKQRGGLRALSEASVALLLESEDSVRSRGGQVLARFLGQGMASDALGVGKVDPAGRGLERAIHAALQRAGLVAGDIEAVWSARSGFAPIDRAERSALARIFGRVPVHAPKLVLGEPLGAGGSLCTALAVRSFADGAAGPALVTSLTLGGGHVALVVAPPAAS